MTTEYGIRLKQARKNAGLTQVQLSVKTGIAQSTISTAEREGTGSNDAIYASACKVDALWLATGEGEMAPASVGNEKKKTEGSPAIEESVRLLAQSINTSPSKGSDALAGTMVSLSKDPGNPIYQEMLVKLLQPNTRPGVESKDIYPVTPSIFTKSKAHQ